MLGKSSNNSNEKAVSQNYLEGSRSGRIAERERKNGEMLFSRSFYWNLVKEKLIDGGISRCACDHCRWRLSGLSDATPSPQPSPQHFLEAPVSYRACGSKFTLYCMPINILRKHQMQSKIGGC